MLIIFEQLEKLLIIDINHFLTVPEFEMYSKNMYCN